MGLFDSVVRALRGPKCPLTEEERRWVEHRWEWLRAEFGQEPLRRTPLTRWSPELPNRWDASWPEAVTLVGTICRHMGVDPVIVDVRFFGDGAPLDARSRLGEHRRSGPAGLYLGSEDGSRFQLALDLSGLGNPEALVATIAHELGHLLLLGQRRISGDEPDHEPLTDLLTVYFGVGVFSANSSIQVRQWQDGGWQGWSTARLGYLTEAAFGYSLALQARDRKERSPKWIRELTANILHYYEESVHFLAHDVAPGGSAEVGPPTPPVYRREEEPPDDDEVRRDETVEPENSRTE